MTFYCCSKTSLVSYSTPSAFQLILVHCFLVPTQMISASVTIGLRNLFLEFLLWQGMVVMRRSLFHHFTRLIKRDHSFSLTCERAHPPQCQLLNPLALRRTEITLVVSGKSYIVHFWGAKIQKLFLSNVWHGRSALYTSVRFLWHLSTSRLSSLGW